jgi:hypothetical protein
VNGIHWAEGDIAFLLQAGTPQTALDFGVACPFPPSKKPCEHRIDLSLPSPDREFPDHQLVDAMSPVPRSDTYRIPFVTAGEGKLWLATLARMSSPTGVPIRPMWALTSKDIFQELEKTNVQPLVLVDVHVSERKKLDQVVAAAPYLPRKLVLEGTRDVILPPGTDRIGVPDSHLIDVLSLPWEAYGAQLLRRHMLKR